MATVLRKLLKQYLKGVLYKNMSICSGIGSGIGGKLGTWGAGLGSALGLGAVVDLGVKGYTGYGLLETLSVPYIECSDGSFATALEWYGSGLKCPKKSESVKPQMQAPQPSQSNAALGYEEAIKAMGGSTSTYWGMHTTYSYKAWLENKVPFDSWPYKPGYPFLETAPSDDFGNVWPTNYMEGSDGLSTGFSLNGDAASRLLSVNDGVFGGGWRTTSDQIATFGNILNKYPYQILGTRARLPNYEKAPPATSIPPPPAFVPSPPLLPEKCEMSCPCISPQQIEKAIKKALGVEPFSPEKLIRELGAQMYAAPGPSVVPIVPKNLIDAIAGLIAANYMRAGFGRYPVIMPDSLIASDNLAGDAVPTNSIENQAEWLEWMIKQKDAIDGEWPIDITIKDGIQSKPMRFENVAEALAEITGLVVQVAADADTAVNAACTAAGIAQKAVNAATIGQKNVECLIQCFGFRTGFRALFVQSSITPADPDDKNFNVRKFLSPSSQNLAVLTDNDDFDFQAMLDRILRNTEVARASVARSVEKDGLPGDFARNQRKHDGAEALRETEKAMEKLETTLKQQNPQMQLKIKVNASPTNSILGDNFVIKRPKT
jgi:hypothetical protein